MAFPLLPTSIEAIDPCQWETFRPFFEELQQRPVTPETTRQWLQDWSRFSELFSEAISWIYIQKSLDTTNDAKEQAFLDYLNRVAPQAQVANHALKEKLLTLEVPDADMALVLRDIRNEAALFRQENVPLLLELDRLNNEYDKLTGGLKADWDGEEKNLSELSLFLQDKNRSVRERSWKTQMGLWAGIREPINNIYSQMVTLRRQVAANAGLSDYRVYAFRDRGRFDYTPEDCFTFHDAIEAVVVPAAQRIYEKKRQRLGLETLRPWDVLVDTSDAPSLKPYQTQDELIQGSLNILHHVDAELGRQFATMAEENLLDLQTRSGKALGGYCSTLAMRKRPFIFMNGVGIHDNVQVLLHEAGHAFHVFGTADLPLIWQTRAPMEFCEVASMSMELLASPYLEKQYGGFYSASEVARARIEHLESLITFWPYMAVVDSFQHWVYTHPDEAVNPANCDAAWGVLWQRFMVGQDWQGFEAERVSGWQRKPHIFEAPFYYIEYGMAQVGAVQVWRNSLKDQAGAVATYRKALALGGTQTLPQLFQAAGVEFRFDTAMLSDLVGLVEQTVAELEAVL